MEALPVSPELAWAWGSRAIELALKFDATETLVHALNNVGFAQLLAHEEEGRAKLKESLRLSLAHNLEEHASRAFTNISAVSVWNRDYEAALRYLNEGIAYATEHDLESCESYMTMSRARVHFETGRWTQATDDAATLIGHSHGYSVTRISALTVLAGC